MNDIQLHLMVNHFPIMGMFFGSVIFLIGMIKKKISLHYTAIGLYIFSAITGIISNNTGEGAEHILEEAIPTISHDLIHEHEEAAELLFPFLIVIGVLSILYLLLLVKGKSIARFVGAFTFIAGIVVTAMAFNVGKSGGEVRHLEEMNYTEVEHD